MRDIPTEKEITRWLDEGKVIVIEQKEGYAEVAINEK